MSGQPPYVAVVGPGDVTDQRVIGDAYAVGAALARAGAVVVTGGLGGVMAAATRGAAAEGGTTLALLPGDDRSAADPAATVAVATGLGEGRDLLVVRAADVLVAVGGSWGTLIEVALARRTGRPVVGLRGWQVRTAAGVPVPDGVLAAVDPADAVRQALALAGQPSSSA